MLSRDRERTAQDGLSEARRPRRWSSAHKPHRDSLPMPGCSWAGWCRGGRSGPHRRSSPIRPVQSRWNVWIVVLFIRIVHVSTLVHPAMLPLVRTHFRFVSVRVHVFIQAHQGQIGIVVYFRVCPSAMLHYLPVHLLQMVLHLQHPSVPRHTSHWENPRSAGRATKS